MCQELRSRCCSQLLKQLVHGGASSKFPIRSFFSVLVAVVIFCCGWNAEQMPEPATEEAEVSSKCAAVLLSASMIGRVSLAYAVTPAALCSAGFYTTAVAGGSFVS